MGLRRARDGALGLAAVRLWLVLPLVALLGGCTSLGSFIGVVAGGVAGGASANPAVGFGVGVATAAVSDYTIKIVTRHWHRGEQDAIARTAGALQPGQASPWRVRHSVPIGNEHGQLLVTADIPNALAPCKRVLFSVQANRQAAPIYAVDICQQARGWKWASAEPAVERWGFLQ